MVLEVVGQAQHVELIERNQFVEQEQVQRRSFESGRLVQLAVGFADLVVLLGFADLVDDEFDDRLLDLRPRRVFRQFGFDAVLDTFGDLGRFERIVQHQQRIVVAVRSAVATAGVFREIGSLRRQRDGSETFAGRRQVFGRRQRRNRLDSRLRVDIVHDVARNRPPLGHRGIFDLHAFGIRFVEEQRDLATVQETQEVIDRLGIKIGITGRIVRVVDNDRSILAEQIPQAAAVVEQRQRRFDPRQAVDQPIVSQAAVCVVLDLDVERIDVETVVRQQILILPSLYAVVNDIGFRTAVRIEQQVADNHLHRIRCRSLIHIAERRQEILDDILVVVA